MSSPSASSPSTSRLSASLHPVGLLSSRRPLASLTLFFWLWKALLFLAVVACPGPGYDTSTTLLPVHTTHVSDVTSPVNHPGALSIPLRFVRWDSIYFVHIVRNGYAFEQEWAFGYGYTKALRFLASIVPPFEGLGDADRIALTGVVLSHVVHYLSVLALYRLSVNVFGYQTVTQRRLSYLSAALHVISPAGAFLSAPYGEALFSFLNITGSYVYSSSLYDDRIAKRASRDVKVLTAAVLFAAATMVRSNGILSGFLFAYDAVLLFWQLLSDGLSVHPIIRLGVIILGGCIVAVGLILPQFVAYTTFCMSEGVSRPWCEWTVPSIYRWVQDQYWNVGFLKYWTVSNLPLFLLALPMLVLLCRSSLWALKLPFIVRQRQSASPTVSFKPAESLLIHLAVPQGLLAVMAFTSYHVQIINRISSGYPVWYWYLASQLLNHFAGPKSEPRHGRVYTLAAQSMVLYALIQAVLFGSFLPPA